MSQLLSPPSFNMGTTPSLMYPLAEQEFNNLLASTTIPEGNMYTLGYGKLKSSGLNIINQYMNA